MHKLPNLYRNRLGTYYLRITVAGREVKRSLGKLAKAAGTAQGVRKTSVGRAQRRRRCRPLTGSGQDEQRNRLRRTDQACPSVSARGR